MGLDQIKHVVILVQENRSFDEYFGTFPGVAGFFDPPASFANQYGSGILPFRMSTFSASGLESDICGHNWDTFHSLYSGGQNVWAQSAGGVPANPPSVLGYYAADDIPFHWALASAFTLCDNYFCSVLGPTESNRLVLMTGTTTGGQPPDDVTANPGNPGYATPPGNWSTYPDMLSAANPPVTWTIYDEQYNPPSWWQGTAPSPDNGWGDLNILNQFPNWGDYSGNPQHYQTTPGQFEADAKTGNLPTVSWIIPPFGLTEWEDNHPSDAAYYIAQKLDAILDGDWDSTVLILTYDEFGGHFDHVRHALPTSAEEPYINGKAIGPGLRVPTIIISPWTVGRPVQHDPFDHTSVVQFLEKVTGVPCANLPDGGWRRATFGDLTSVFDFTQQSSAAEAKNAFPWRQDLAEKYMTNAQKRLMAYLPYPADPPGPLPDGSGNVNTNVLGPPHQTPVRPLQPPPPQWPPVPQSCQVVLVLASYGKDQVLSQAQGGPAATFQGAMYVTVEGFEPAELVTPYALGGFTPGQPSGQPTLAGNVRIPALTVTNAAGSPAGNVTITCSSVSPDPTQTVTPSGLPCPFTFSYDVTFSDLTDPATLAATFPAGPPQTWQVNAVFSVDTTVTAAAPLELVASANPQFYQLLYEQTPWLSNELRVFQLKASETAFTLTQQQAVGSDPVTFISTLLGALRDSVASGDGLAKAWFDNLQESESQTWLSLLPDDGTEPVYNFAVARVHMEGLDQAHNVAVFFRLFPAATTSTAYSSSYNYRSVANATGLIAVPGVGWGAQQGQYVTLPFYAAGRVPFSDPLSQQSDSLNVQDIPVNAALLAPATAYEAYYGCWLDINQSAEQYIPADGVPANPADVSGPFPWNGPDDPESPLAWIRNLHQCVVAEISYPSGFTIPYLATPGTSAWLAQRNLAFTPSTGSG
jgi:phospholipase C